EKIKKLEDKAQTLREEITDLNKEKNKLLKDMHSVKMKQWTAKAKQVSGNMDIPKEWREGANKTIDKASDIFDETSKTIGKIGRASCRERGKIRGVTVA